MGSALDIIILLLLVALFGLFVLTSRTWRLLKATRENFDQLKAISEHLAWGRMKNGEIEGHLRAMRAYYKASAAAADTSLPERETLA